MANELRRDNGNVLGNENFTFVIDPLHDRRNGYLFQTNPLGALRAFGGAERRIDVGRADERLFLNNVSLGIYARLVHRREQHRHRREAFARVEELLHQTAGR